MPDFENPQKNNSPEEDAENLVKGMMGEDAFEKEGVDRPEDSWKEKQGKEEDGPEAENEIPPRSLKKFNLAIEDIDISEEKRQEFRDKFISKASNKPPKETKAILGRVLLEAQKAKKQSNQETKDSGQDDKPENDISKQGESLDKEVQEKIQAESKQQEKEEEIEPASEKAEAESEPEEENLEVSLKVAERFKSEMNIKKDDLEDLDGFVDLSEGQQLLALENLKQMTLGRIEDEASEEFKQDIKTSKFLGKLWKGMTKHYQMGKLQEEKGEDILYGGMKVHEETLRQLVDGLKEFGPEVEEKNGALNIKFLSAEKDLDPRQQEKLEYFNNAANEFARIPEEWKHSSSRSERNKFEKTRQQYEQAKQEVLNIKKESKGEGEASQEMNQADFQVYANRLLSNDPEVEKALENIDNQKAWKNSLKDIFKEKGVMLGGGFVARSGATALLGAVGGSLAAFGAPLGAAGIGGYRGWKRSQEELAEQDKQARRGGSGQVDWSYYNKRVEELQDIKNSEKTSPEEKKRAQRSLKHLEEARRAMNLNESSQEEKEKAQKFLEDHLGYYKYHVDQNVEEKKDVVEWDYYSNSLRDLEDILDSEESSDEQKQEALKSLSYHLEEIEHKMEKGEIDFGTDKERLYNQYSLIQELGQSQAREAKYGYLVSDKLSEQYSEDREVVDEFVGNLENLVEGNRKKYARTKALQSAAASAGFAFAGQWLGGKFADYMGWGQGEEVGQEAVQETAQETAGELTKEQQRVFNEAWEDIVDRGHDDVYSKEELGKFLRDRDYMINNREDKLFELLEREIDQKEMAQDIKETHTSDLDISDAQHDKEGVKTGGGTEKDSPEAGSGQETQDQGSEQGAVQPEQSSPETETQKDDKDTVKKTLKKDDSFESKIDENVWKLKEEKIKKIMDSSINDPELVNIIGKDGEVADWEIKVGESELPPEIKFKFLRDKDLGASLEANPSLAKKLEGMDPKLLDKITKSGAVSETDIKVARAEFSPEAKSELLDLSDSEKENYLQYLNKLKDVDDKALSLVKDQNLTELKEYVGAVNSLAHTVEQGDNITTAARKLLESSNTSNEVKDAFIDNYYPDHDDITKENRKELLEQAVNKMSVSNLKMGDGNDLKNLIYKGNEVHINSETGDIYVEKGSSKLEAKAVGERALRENWADHKARELGLDPEKVDFGGDEPGERELETTAEVNGDSYRIRIDENNNWTAQVEGGEVSGRFEKGDSLASIKEEIRSAGAKAEITEVTKGYIDPDKASELSSLEKMGINPEDGLTEAEKEKLRFLTELAENKTSWNEARQIFDFIEETQNTRLQNLFGHTLEDYHKLQDFFKQINYDSFRGGEGDRYLRELTSIKFSPDTQGAEKSARFLFYDVIGHFDLQDVAVSRSSRATEILLPHENWGPDSDWEIRIDWQEGKITSDGPLLWGKEGNISKDTLDRINNNINEYFSGDSGSTEEPQVLSREEKSFLENLPEDEVREGYRTEKGGGEGRPRVLSQQQREELRNLSAEKGEAPENPEISTAESEEAREQASAESAGEGKEASVEASETEPETPDKQASSEEIPGEIKGLKFEYDDEGQIWKIRYNLENSQPMALIDTSNPEAVKLYHEDSFIKGKLRKILACYKILEDLEQAGTTESQAYETMKLNLKWKVNSFKEFYGEDILKEGLLKRGNGS